MPDWGTAAIGDRLRDAHTGLDTIADRLAHAAQLAVRGRHGGPDHQFR